MTRLFDIISLNIMVHISENTEKLKLSKHDLNPFGICATYEIPNVRIDKINYRLFLHISM